MPLVITRKPKTNPVPLSASLSSYVSQDDYWPGRFPSLDSLKWYTRLHRKKLAQRGAIAKIAGRMRINAPVFDELMVEIGRSLVEAA